MPFDSMPTEVAPLTADECVTPRQRLLYLRDFIAALPDKKFNMCTFGQDNPECGTVACIGGWASELFFEERWNGCSMKKVCDALGITESVGNVLFSPGSRDLLALLRGESSVTREIAVRNINHVIETGEALRWYKLT